MIERPPQQPEPREARRRSALAAGSRRYRQRQKVGERVVRVTVDHEILDLFRPGAIFSRNGTIRILAQIAEALQTALHCWSRYEPN